MAILIETTAAAKKDTETKGGPIVGIDLGTTNSLVAVVRDGRVEVLNSREGKHLVPSIVSFVEDQPIVGYRAKHEKVRDAKHTVFSVKRLLGRGFDDLKDVKDSLPFELVSDEGAPKVRVGDRIYSAIEVSAMILRELKLSAEQALGVTVNRAVITVPAYFDDAQRQATRTAGRIAGLDVLRIINEPTAASLAYGLDKKKQGLIAVYDLGGGTFDLSILKLHDGIFEVLATHGDTTLGGDDLDRTIVEASLRDIQTQFGSNAIDFQNDAQIRAALLEAAEKLKIALSTQSQAVFEVQLASKQVYRKEWSLAEFEACVLPVLERSRIPCMKALEDCGLKTSDLSDVVLVGGPSRLRVVQDLAERIFGRKPNTSLHPDEVVAEGAAIQADILAGNNKDMLLLDVVPLSLGLETYGGVMSPLIHRNSKIPAAAREIFTTFADNQTAVDIHVLQGEREKVESNRSLARFKLGGLEPMPAGLARVEVIFLIDADGILQVAAKDLKTGKERSVEVRPSFGLTDTQVEEMLMASQANAEADVHFRKLVNAKNQAEPVLRAAEKRVADAHRLLSSEDAGQIEEAIRRLKAALLKDNLEELQEANRQLNQRTMRLAELLIKDL